MKIIASLIGKDIHTPLNENNDENMITNGIITTPPLNSETIKECWIFCVDVK